MTIYKTILAKGYLPKELPPAFFSDDFATFATTRSGRAALAAYRPQDNLTECTAYRLALPAVEHRVLRIPHPSSFASLVGEIAKAFRRLLKKAGTSPFARSRPVYSTADSRAIRTLVDPANLSRERTLSRAGASFLLKADVSQFYPSLYTHAVGWAVDPKLRLRANWRSRRFLGKRLDQRLMDMQGKISQGIPIGNDVSFLLAEIVLGQVDKDLRQYAGRAFRWFDDYEIACDSREQAEAALLQLRTSLNKFNLRLNPRKTTIVELPTASSDGWQRRVVDASRGMHLSARNMVAYFDSVFDLRHQYPDIPILLYAIGLLFRLAKPTVAVLRVAESCIAQAILSEPGCAQKAFALLTFWGLNGASISRPTVAAAIERVILRHGSMGTSSDVSWALAFCIDQRLALSRKVGNVLSRFDDDCIAIQSLHAHAAGLIPAGFSRRAIEAELRGASLDGPHWLALYESVRHGFIPALDTVVRSAPLFGEMLAKNVSFYRQAVPAYAAIVHPGGAPNWVVRAWLAGLAGVASGAQAAADAAAAVAPPTGVVADMIREDAKQLPGETRSVAEVVAKLLDKLQRERVEPDAVPDRYA